MAQPPAREVRDLEEVRAKRKAGADPEKVADESLTKRLKEELRLAEAEFSGGRFNGTRLTAHAG